MQATTNKPMGYMIPVGKTDDERLKALGAFYNPLSMDLISSNCTLKNPKILDVGCGNGHLTNLFAKTFNDSVVVGVDISKEQIEVAKANAEEENLINVSWGICDVNHLNDLQEKYPELFDVVHTRFVLTHLPDPAKAIEPMLSMVKRGGLLLIEEIGAKKSFKEPVPKPVLAWKKMTEYMHKYQQSHEDTIEKVVSHLSNLDNVVCHTKLFNVIVEGQQKKSMFRIGAEHGVKILEKLGKSEVIKTFGYEDGDTWLEEMKKFELDDSVTVEAQNMESIVASKIK